MVSERVSVAWSGWSGSVYLKICDKVSARLTPPGTGRAHLTDEKRISSETLKRLEEKVLQLEVLDSQSIEQSPQRRIRGLEIGESSRSVPLVDAVASVDVHASDVRLDHVSDLVDVDSRRSLTFFQFTQEDLRTKGQHRSASSGTETYRVEHEDVVDIREDNGRSLLRQHGLQRREEDLHDLISLYSTSTIDLLTSMMSCKLWTYVCSVATNSKMLSCLFLSLSGIFSNALGSIKLAHDVPTF
jgi:hypothetical protein